MFSGSKTWNEELKEWYDSNSMSYSKIKEISGIPRSTFRDYIGGRITNLEKISPERKKALYNLTGLECFGDEKDEYETLSRIIEEGKRGLEKLAEELALKLTGSQKLKSGLLKIQIYQPSAQQRVDAIMELLDVLSEEVDYFRSASEEEKKILVERLQKEPESFGYVSQILNIIYSGKNINSWMLMTQPPSKLKRIIQQ